MTVELDSRLRHLKDELDDHSRVAHHLGLDLERPIRSLGDGYPENAVSWVGKITERILKQLWRHHQVQGDPAGKSLSELIRGCRPHISSGSVLEALHDIQTLRNRSAHDGYTIAEEDGLTAVRRLVQVLTWFSTTGSQALTGEVPRLTPEVAAKVEFLAGLYLTLGFQSVKRFELTPHTVYQLFSREIGLRTEYVELLMSRDVDEVHQVLDSTGGELLRTRLPKLTRFLVLESDEVVTGAFEDYRVVAYSRFMDTLVDIEAHLQAVTLSMPGEFVPLAAELLTAGQQSADMSVSRIGDAHQLLDEVARSSGNLLLVGRSGSGKTVLLQRLVAAGRDDDARRYRFYFDMSLKRPDETFPEFVSRTLAPFMSVDSSHVFDVFHYFARSGSILCALDGVDEAVADNTQAGFLELFGELAQVLSANSTIIMSSRVSFLEDSPHVRRLMDGTTLMSERLVQQLHAQGIDPLSVPRFSALRLHEEISPLERQLTAVTGLEQSLPDLLWARLISVFSDASLITRLPRAVELFGTAVLEGRTTFSLAEICNTLGIGCFDQGVISWENYQLNPLFRRIGAERVAFSHLAYQELLAAEHLRSPDARQAAAGGRLTEQIRALLHHRAKDDLDRDDRVLTAGTYLVGPSHHLMLRAITQPVRFDRYPVTVGEYNAFLAAVDQHGSAQWDHPETPAGHSHRPWQERLRLQDYYLNPAYSDHPAVCVDWWSAFAYARFTGKRLPTSLEWEAAARGTDGRLFPWGDDIDLDAANCADAYAGHALVTYEAWLAEHERGSLRHALPEKVGTHPRNRSPIGVRHMVGNVWELTSTTLNGHDDMVVICGGAFDNPYRAMQASSKGFYQRHRSSNVVGFRCVEDLD
ncbi:SUMF1/EgtB/PvdO family nonheme iron enzyme [Spirillospora sp. NPDC052269]